MSTREIINTQPLQYIAIYDNVHSSDKHAISCKIEIKVVKNISNESDIWYQICVSFVSTS